MQKRRLAVFTLFGILSCLSSWAYSNTNAQNLPTLEKQRALFLEAEDALKHKKYEKFELLTETLKTYPLYPYLRYKELTTKLSDQKKNSTPQKKETISSHEIKDFITTYQDTPLASQLHTRWVKRLAKQKDWKAFLTEYTPATDSDYECLYWYANYQTTQDKQFLEKAQKLWSVGYSRPKQCDPLFREMKNHNLITQDMVWKRFTLSLENNELSLAQYLRRHFHDKDKKVSRTWYELNEKPERLTQGSWLKKLPKESQKNPVFLTQALLRYARKDPEKAFDSFESLKKQYAFTDTQRGQIIREIAIMGALQKHPKAGSWLKNIPQKALTQSAQEWRIRYAISQQDWQNVLNSIEKADERIQNQKAWRYFKARALEQLGSLSKANALYAQLASSRNYYGFLASIKLKQTPNLRTQIVPSNPDQIHKLASQPAFLRVKELKRLERHTEARAEWILLISKRSELERIVASRLAQDMGWHDLAIYTMGQTQYKDDVPLRFPLAYSETIFLHAEKQDLDPSWIFGLTRQESAFMPDVTSTAGATGLMQLMPKTAEFVSQKHQIPYQNQPELFEPALNIHLGTTYLKHLLTNLDGNLILAAAAYNAGPHRIERWRPETTIDADLWIETIPFFETRNYVQNVVTYTEIYQQLLNQDSQFKTLMRPIPGQAPDS